MLYRDFDVSFSERINRYSTAPTRNWRISSSTGADRIKSANAEDNFGPRAAIGGGPYVRMLENEYKAVASSVKDCTVSKWNYRSTP